MSWLWNLISAAFSGLLSWMLGRKDKAQKQLEGEIDYANKAENIRAKPRRGKSDSLEWLRKNNRD